MSSPTLFGPLAPSATNPGLRFASGPIPRCSSRACLAIAEAERPVRLDSDSIARASSSLITIVVRFIPA